MPDNWLSRLFGKKAPEKKPENEAPGVMSALSNSRNPPARGTSELIQAYAQIPMLRSIVQRIAENFAAVPWTVHIVSSKGKTVRSKKIEGTPCGMRKKAFFDISKAGGNIVELDDDPLLDFLNAGCGYCDGFSVRQVMAAHLELKGEAFGWIERNPFGMPVYLWPVPPNWITDIPSPGRSIFELSIGGRRSFVPKEDMLFIRDPDPANPYGRGTGVGESLGDELDTSEYISTFIRAFFYNDATPSMLLAFPADQAVSKEAVTRISSEWDERHRGAQKSRRAHFLNAAPNVTQFGQSFSDMSLVDLQKFIRDVIRETWGVPPEIMGLIENSNRATIDDAGYIFARWILTPRLDRWTSALQTQIVPQFDERKIIGYVSPIPEDRAYELKVATAQPAMRTRNEWRELQGLPNRGPEDDVYLQPAISIPEPAPALPKPGSTKGMHSVVNKAMITEDQINPILASLKADRLRQETKGLWSEELKQWGQDALDELGVEISFDLLNPRIQKHLNSLAGEKINDINGTTLDSLREQLVDGVKAGEGSDDIAKRVRDVFSHADKVRSKLIARTEVLGSANFAEYEAQKMSGVVEEREWIATPDNRARELHLAINGQVRKLDEPFDFADGVQMMHPGDGPASHVCNCRCTTGAHFARKKSYSKEECAAMWKAFDRKLTSWERAAELAFRRGFRAQEDDVIEALDREASKKS